MLKYLLPLLFALNASAQVNLVPNGSFEECYVCNRHLLSDVYLDTAYIPFIKNWFYAKASPDYFNKNNIDNNGGGCWGQGGHTPPNSVYGFQYPRTDSSYLGLVTHGGPGEYLEWAGVKLREPLKKDTCYEFTMYVSRAEKSHRIVSSLGAYFTSDSIWESYVAPINIPFPFDSSVVQVQHNPWNTIYDTVNWIPISGIFKAQGGEQFLYIGNLLKQFQYQIITVYDTLQAHNGASCDFSYFFIDDVSLYEVKGACTVGLSESPAQQITFFPNPASNTLTISTGNLKNAQVEFFDISGRKLFQQNLSASQQSIDVSGYANGIYICAVTANGKVVRREKVVISH